MKKIIFLGDSITDASHCFLENPLGNGYVNMVAEKLNDSDGGRKKYDIMNRGHDGFTIHGVKRILEKECILKRPDVVSILIGCNDVGVMMNTGKSLEEQQFEACYEAIVKEITEQSDAKLICMSPFIVPYPRMYENWIPGIKQTERIEKKIAEKYHADFLALQDMIILKAEKAGYESVTTDWIKEQIGAEYLKNCMVPGVINIPEKRRNYVDSLLDKLMFENDTPDILSTAFIKAGLVELLLFIIRCKEYEDNVIKEIDVDNRKIQEVATYIFEHYTENILLEDVADKFDMNKSFLSKRFKTATGFGFKEYIINLRIQNACRLLLETNKSITDIAFECGFNDSNYFGDSFRKIKGISPRKYRKNETF